MFQRKLAPFFVLSLFLTCTLASTKVWCPHVTNIGGWKTRLALFNPTGVEVAFQLTRFDSSGEENNPPFQGVVSPHAWLTVSSPILDYEGTACLESAANVLSKVSYQFGDSPNLCEFNLLEQTLPGWVLPCVSDTGLTYTGITLVNPGSESIPVTFEAWKSGVKVFPDVTAEVGPRGKFARLTREIWSLLLPSDVDTLIIRSSAPIPAPICITGKESGDRALFFSAQPEVRRQTTTLRVPHLTALGGWSTTLSLFNPGDVEAEYQVALHDPAGNVTGETLSGVVTPRSWSVVEGASLAVEGSAQVFSGSGLLLRAGYRFNGSPVVCDFFLSEDAGMAWVVPNPLFPWLDYTGVALLNPLPGQAVVTVEAWKEGIRAAPDREFSLGPGERFVLLSNQIWPELSYSGLDTIVIRSSVPIPSPISITGNLAGDRLLFFPAREEPQNGVPVVTTSPVAGFTITTACTGGEVTDDGGSAVITRGVCWSTTSDPDLGDSHTVNGFGLGAFSSILTGLEPGTLYFVRAYATNSRGTGYGTETSFTTTPVFKPTVILVSAKPLTAHEAEVTGEVTEAGGAPVTVRGVCWSPSPGPTESGPHTIQGSGLGVFRSILTGLSTGIPYYCRAFATNRAGTAYSEEKVFICHDGTLNPGEVVEVDPVVGPLRFVPPGTFVQGSPEDEIGHEDDETQFTHTLTRNLAVMETEMTRGMWAHLQQLQPTLPRDLGPTVGCNAGADIPVQKIRYWEACLCANLLSLQRGLRRCYYLDAGYTVPATAENYLGPTNYHWDESADGFRLPTEGEWEYFCRAGTSTPFWLDEPNLTDENYRQYDWSGLFPTLETADWLRQDDCTHPVGTKLPNPWGLYDLHGNAWELCYDTFGPYPTGNQVDYHNSTASNICVIRGGSTYWYDDWYYPPITVVKLSRSPNRAEAAFSFWEQYFQGLRLVRTLPAELSTCGRRMSELTDPPY